MLCGYATRLHFLNEKNNLICKKLDHAAWWKEKASKLKEKGKNPLFHSSVGCCEKFPRAFLHSSG